MQTLADYIMVTHDALPPALVRDLLDEYSGLDIWLPYMKEGAGGGEVIPISEPKIIGDSAKRKDLEATLTTAFTEVIRKYHERNAQINKGKNFLMMDRFTGFRLLRYSVGQSMWLHADRHPDIKGSSAWPVLACTINLNDDYEGGELVVLDGEVTVPPRTGDAVMFPANFLYPHEVKEVTRGVRYAIVTWAL